MDAFPSGRDSEHRGESHKDSQMDHHIVGGSHQSTDLDVEGTRAPNIFERVKEEFEAIQQDSRGKHDRELVVHHGSDRNHNEDLDVEDVRAPNIFERVKEEIEAITQSSQEKHNKKDQIPSQNGDESANAGCWTHMGKTLQRFCGGSKT